MAESIVKIISSILGFFTVRYTDKVIGKWVAYFSIAWELTATKGAKDAYAKAAQEFKDNSSDKYKKWEEWRREATRRLEDKGPGARGQGPGQGKTEIKSD